MPEAEMPRTALTITESTKAGTTLPVGTAADVANGNSIVHDGRSLVIIATNSGVSTRTITITPTAAVDGLAVAARTISMAASAVKLLGPFELSTYGSPLAISADHADIKFQPVRIPGV
jgi:hypothetical protein